MLTGLAGFNCNATHPRQNQQGSVRDISGARDKLRISGNSTGKTCANAAGRNDFPLFFNEYNPCGRQGID